VSKYPKIAPAPLKSTFNQAASATPPAPKAKPVNPPALVIPPPKLAPGAGPAFVSRKPAMAKAAVAQTKSGATTGVNLSAKFNKSSSKKI